MDELSARSYKLEMSSSISRANIATAATDADANGEPVLAQSHEYRVSGTVRIDPSLATDAAPGTTLFVYATDATSSGPPLAFLRLRVDRWPVSFVLDDADAMIPGRNLSSSKRIRLEARISPCGDALPRPGDLVGQVESVDPGGRQPVDISIDRKIA